LEYDKNTIDPKERVSAVVKELNDERIVEYNRLKEQADNQTFETNRRKRFPGELSSVIQDEMLVGKNADELQNEQSTFGAIASVIGDGARWLADEINPMNIARDAILQPEYSTKKIGAVSRFGANVAINSLEDAMKFTADMEDSLRQMGINIPAFSLEEMRFKSSDEMLALRQENAYATGDATSDMNMGRIGNPTEIETMLEPIASYFLTSLFGGGPTKLAGTVLAAGTIDLQEGNLSNVLADFGILPELAEYLGSRPENAEVGYERLNLRMRNLVEEGVLTAAFLALPMTFKMLKNSGVQFTLGTTALTAIPEEAEAKGGVGKLVNRVLDELGFFSEAVEQTKRLDIEKGSGTQFLSLLKKAGVKDEELKWTGLDDLLKNKKVTKQEILDQLENEAVELEEIPKTVRQEELEMNFSASEDNVLLDDLYLKDVAKGNDEPDKKLLRSTVTAEEAFGPEYLNNRADEIYDELDNAYNDPGNKRVTDPPNIDDAYNEAVEEYYYNPIRIYEDENTGMVITGNDDVGYSIFNNRAESSSWKNRIKTLNNDEVVYDLDEAKIEAQQIAVDDGKMGFADDAVQYSEYIVSGGDNYREFLLRFPNYGIDSFADKKNLSFNASHFDEENIVAHFRTTDIKGPNGEKALFIEEIQSDWAQQGRSRGFEVSEAERENIENTANEIFKKHENELSKYTIQVGDKRIPYMEYRTDARLENMKRELNFPSDIEMINQDFNENVRAGMVYLNGKKVPSNAYHAGKLEELMQEHTKVMEPLKNDTIPNAPFVSDPKYQRNWTALSIKRILAKAVEEGYEYVSFATGDLGAAQNYFARSNDGLKKYYGETIPSVLNKLIKKYDSEALVAKGSDTTTTGKKKYETGSYKDGYYESGDQGIFDDSLKVKLTDKLKNAIKEGQALFAIPTAVTGAGVAMNNTNEMRN